MRFEPQQANIEIVFKNVPNNRIADFKVVACVASFPWLFSQYPSFDLAKPNRNSKRALDLDRIVELSNEQLAKLLAKSLRESRKNCKRYLHDLGGDGSAEELDRVLSMANENAAVVRLAAQIDRDRMAAAATIDKDLEDHIESIREEIRSEMHERNLDVSDLAVLCRLSSDLVASIVEGDRMPTVEQLVKIAAALGKRWQLK